MSRRQHRKATFLDALLDRARLRAELAPLERYAFRIGFDESNGALSTPMDVAYAEALDRQIAVLRAKGSIQRGDMIPTRRQRRRMTQ